MQAVESNLYWLPSSYEQRIVMYLEYSSIQIVMELEKCYNMIPCLFAVLFFVGVCLFCFFQT